MFLEEADMNTNKTTPPHTAIFKDLLKAPTPLSAVSLLAGVNKKCTLQLIQLIMVALWHVTTWGW